MIITILKIATTKVTSSY